MSLLPKSDTDYSRLSADEVLESLESQRGGLSQAEVEKRQKEFGLNLLHKRRINLLSILLRQFSGNPLIIVLALATLVSFLLGERVSSYYIFGLIAASVIFGFWNEFTAEKTVDDLLKKIPPTSLVVRQNGKREIPASQLTVGDLVWLSPGSIVPADLRLFETKDLEINEAALTGESEPKLKQGPENLAFMGTNVQNGSGLGIVFRLGEKTQFGKIAQKSSFVKPTTEFQKGLFNFGQLIVKVVLALTLVIFIVNALLGHALLESVLFALAIAVGLTPELLPVIVTISLSHGAGKLAKKHVVAKQLIAIENLGNMDVLATDKTGTLTEGKIELTNFYDEKDQKSPDLFLKSLLCNSAVLHHQAIGNGIDTAIWDYALKNKISLPREIKKIDEEPFDYNHKMMYTVVEKNGQLQILVKGAPEAVLNLCENPKKETDLKKFNDLAASGLRVVVIAAKEVERQKNYGWEDLQNLTYEGYLTFLDTPRKTAKEALARLHHLNVTVKIITGDNEMVTQKICQEVGMEVTGIVLGTALDDLSDQERLEAVEKNNVFARVNPEQKLKIIQTLRAGGHAVGFLGDGVNDTLALRNADVGISVSSGVDVAKDTAAIVLLRKSLDVITDGIIEGRRTFSNTIKYILMSTSSNFGNMFSAAGASFFLPFLPMTPLQILLTNGLYDVSQMSLPSDNVDLESLRKPRHWNINFIRNYMVFFGPLSSIYDFLTFAVMIFIFKAQGSLFQTGWFIESVATEILVVFVIRTARTPFFRSHPSRWLALTGLGLTGVGVTLPFTPLAPSLGFTAPPPLYFGLLLALVSTYLILVEIVKNLFLRKNVL